MPDTPQNSGAKRKPPVGKRFAPGKSGNPGGRPKSIREVEAMLERDHRNAKKMKRTFALIRRVAHGVDEPVYYQGAVCGYKRKYDSGWMELYLNRVLGPVKELKIDLTDAPQSVVEWLAENVEHLN